MTTREQMHNKAIDYSEEEENFLEYDDCGDVCDDKTFIEKAFENGAEYGYNLALEKAIDWFVKNWRNYLIQDKDNAIGLIGWQWDIKEYLKL